MRNQLPGIARSSPLAAVVGSGHLATLMQAVSMAQSVHAKLETWREQRRAERAYTISVDEQDDVYPHIHDWLLRRVPRERHRSLVATTHRVGPGGAVRSSDSMCDEDEDDEGATVAVRYRYNGQASLGLTMGGHRVRAWVTTDSDQADEGGDDKRRTIWRVERVCFQADSAAGAEAIKRTIEGVARSTAKRRVPRLYLASPYGHWEQRGPLEGRPLSTVVLADGQVERLCADIARFLGNEAALKRLGQHWHRGYLLSGPPGTGKTSAIKALAAHFGLDLYYLSLPGIEADTDLHRLFSMIAPRSILLLEDIDGAHAAVSRTDEGPGRVSSSALLNALDGVLTPDGLITMMTSNHKDLLDGALLRRCDVVEEVGYLTDSQAVRLVGALTGRTIPLPSLGDRPLAPFQLVELIKHHVDDMEAARAAIVDFLRSDAGALNDWRAAA